MLNRLFKESTNVDVGHVAPQGQTGSESHSLRDVFTCSVTLSTNRLAPDRNMTEWSGVTSDFRGHTTTSFRCCCFTLLSSPPPPLPSFLCHPSFFFTFSARVCVCWQRSCLEQSAGADICRTVSLIRSVARSIGVSESSTRQPRHCGRQSKSSVSLFGRLGVFFFRFLLSH